MKPTVDESPSIDDRVALGLETNRIDNRAIIPFPDGWQPSELMQSFAPNQTGFISKLLNDGYSLETTHVYKAANGSIISGVVRLSRGTDKQILPFHSSHRIGVNPRLVIKDWKSRVLFTV